MLVESQIAQYKNERPKGLEPLLDFFTKVDSDMFCNIMFGVVKGAAEEKITVTKNLAAKLRKIRKEAY